MRILLLSLFGLACASSPAIDTSKTTAPDVKGEEISYTAGDTTLKGYVAWDTNSTVKRPAVIVAHEWWGQDEYVRMRARMLAEQGYVAFAIDMYGDGKLAKHPADAQKFMTEVVSKMDIAVGRIHAAYDVVKAHPLVDPTKIAAIGYCFGGAVALNMARLGLDLKGVASFHGNLTAHVPAKPNEVKAKVIVFNGADDPFVPAEQVAAFKKEMSDANVTFEFIDFPGAKHSFTVKEATARGVEFKLPLEYNAEADQQSWVRLASFLTEIFS